MAVSALPLDPLVPEALQERIESVRLGIRRALQERVIGEEPDTKRHEVMFSEGPRWFDESRPIHRIHSDAAMFIGGMRALLLQSLHPLAMAGVARHSNYRTDPWGRLQRTAEFLAATTFGPADMAERAIETVKAVHSRVKGTASDGREYSANDPHLLRWVHVAELDSFVAAHRAFGAETLSDHEYDDYVADMSVIARKLGVPAPPVSLRGLRDQLGSFRGELRSTAESRDAARYLLLQPPLDPLGRIPYSVIAAAAVATLPAWARVELRIPPVPLLDRLVARPLGSLLTGTIRWATSETPGEAARERAEAGFIDASLGAAER